MRLLVLMLTAVLCGLPGSAVASRPALPNADDPALEARLNMLAADLRCVVCQNETLAESRASLALDLREDIREMMRAGLSDAEVVASLVDRYGDFVLYRPPLKPLTYALWFGPAIFLLSGLAVAAAALIRRRTNPPSDEVSAEALAQAARLLRSNPDKNLPDPAVVLRPSADGNLPGPAGVLRQNAEEHSPGSARARLLQPNAEENYPGSVKTEPAHSNPPQDAR